MSCAIRETWLAGQALIIGTPQGGEGKTVGGAKAAHNPADYWRYRTYVEMALTSRITLTGAPAEDPEDFFGSSLGVIFPDDVMNQRECVSFDM